MSDPTFVFGLIAGFSACAVIVSVAWLIVGFLAQRIVDEQERRNEEVPAGEETGTELQGEPGPTSDRPGNEPLVRPNGRSQRVPEAGDEQRVRQEPFDQSAGHSATWPK